MRHSLTVTARHKSPTNTLILTLLAAFVLMAASACGNRGPLYLPEQDQASRATSGETDPAQDEAAANEEEKDDADDS